MSNKTEKKFRKQLRQTAKTELGKEAISQTRSAIKKQQAFKVLFKMLLIFNIVLIIFNIVLTIIILKG